MRLLLSLAYVLVLAIVALGIPLAFSLRDRVDAEVHSQALNQASVVAATAADLLGTPHTAELSALVHSSGAAVRGRVLIVAARGQVLADSAGSRELGASYATRPEIVSALRGKAVQTQRASKTIGENILATAVPVVHNGGTIGAVRITQSVAAVNRAVNGTIAELALIAGTVLLLGLLAGGLIARQVALPLRRLEGAARRLAAGELDARAQLEGSSEQRSLSASFNEMADRVQRMISAQREFIADASHELRTPLSALRLRLEEARAAVTPEQAAVELDAGTTEIDRLAAIVDELLVLSRAEDRELAGESVDLPVAVSRAVARWRGLADTRQVALTAGESSAGTAWCAPADVDRVLDVLIENALRYSPAGGEVEIAVSGARIEVRDRGPGLTPGEEAVVFERFHRGSAGRQGPSGSGLGLAIARTLARAWQGEATIENRSGGGAVAILELPAVRP